MSSNLYRALAGVGLLLGALPSAARAQQPTTISGRVTNEANAPVQGATVVIPTLALGAYTNAEGRYTIIVPAGKATGQTATIVVRRIGFAPITRSIALTAGATVTQDFALTAATTQLENIVITSALGIAREKSTLGTAQQQLNTEELNTTFAPNIENQLQGKVSGVNIVGNGTQGGSTSINIRGYTSISANNQPLFVVDGVPVSNADRGSQQQGGGLTGSKDFGNAIQDLNPDDIESLTVLKGPNAAALYGSRAANGVIIITTKRGGAGKASSMDVSTSITFDTPGRLPDFQNSYGQGSAGQFQWVNGMGALDGNDQSYGPKLDGRLIDQFTGPQQPWVAHPDNVSSFFNLGKTEDATFGISGGTDKASARLSLNGQNVSGIIPNEFLRRLGALASGSIQANDHLTIDGSLNYVRSDGLNRPGQGYVGGIMEGLYVWFGRQVDMSALQNWQQSASLNNGPTNREFNWNYSYHNNPYFMQYANPESDQRDRVIASGSAKYKLTDWLTAMVRSGTDTYRYNINADYAQGNIELNNGSNAVNPAYAGAFSRVADTYTENNTDVLLTATRDLTSGLMLTANAGANRRYSSATTSTVTVNGITIPGIYNTANAGLAPINGDTTTNQAVNSTYGSAVLTWNQWWTVEGTARNDWSSTLPQGHNSYFYPSVSTSLVLTDALPSLKNDVLTFLKVRGGTARVGNDAPPYSLLTTYTGNPSHYNGQPLFSLGNLMLNPDLRPETTVSNEGGVEVGLWGGRVSFDASIYDKYTNDLITSVALAPSTGYGSKLVNAGKIDNKGFEALLTVEPVKTARWDWTTTFNFSHNNGKVVSLAPGLQDIVLGGFQGAVETEARVGEPFGTIRGYDIKRDPATGLPLLDNKGQYQATDTMVALGNIQPKWTGGWVNTIRFGHVTFNSTIDIRRGGKIFSGTNFYGQATGTLASTMYGREVDWNNPGILINGIIESTGKPNTTTITSEQFFQSLAYNNIASPYVYDDSYIKLREIRLGYDLPLSLASRLNANAVNVALVGRNLWTSTSVPNIDPEISYNTGSNQGIEYAGVPAARSFGFAIRITP